MKNGGFRIKSEDNVHLIRYVMVIFDSVFPGIIFLYISIQVLTPVDFFSCSCDIFGVNFTFLTDGVVLGL